MGLYIFTLWVEFPFDVFFVQLRLGNNFKSSSLQQKLKIGSVLGAHLQKCLRKDVILRLFISLLGLWKELYHLPQ